MQTATRSEFRRPKVDNLYDVFINVRDDEAEHVKTMIACQQPEARITFKSPHTVATLVTAEIKTALSLTEEA
jgi:ubiquinol oxidase